MSLTKKIDFAVILQVKTANPNGDPANDNRPRTTPEGLGEISDVGVKRKIRDRLQDAGAAIFVQSDDRKTDGCTSLRDRAEKNTPKSAKTEEEIAEFSCKQWLDVRAFGQLFAFKKKAAGKGPKVEGEAEADALSFGIRGPVSLHPAFSAAQVSITSTQITKSVNGSDGKDGKRSSDTMGMKHRVDHGVYSFVGSMSPQLAKKTGFSDADAQLIKQALVRLFEGDASAARPDGSMRVLKLIWWEHNSALGQYSSGRVHDTLTVNNDPANPITLTDLPGLKPEVLDGF